MMMNEDIGVVVVGRNEGGHLDRSIRSVLSEVSSVIYVDSGSTDDSVGIAESLGVMVHRLDSSEPFSAARGRREGARELVAANPRVRFIQFVDGDCSLVPGWLGRGASMLASESDNGIVCGVLSERDPDASIFNRMNACRWRVLPCGNVSMCGGIFMIRRRVYEAAGGFRARLQTGEEAELCRRVREEGYKVVRIDVPMAVHDSQLVKPRDWWKRAVWGGHGDALLISEVGVEVGAKMRREIRSVVRLVIVCPLVAMLSGLLMIVWQPAGIVAISIVMLYVALIGKIAKEMRDQGERWDSAVVYGILCVVRKWPYALGFFGYRLGWIADDSRPDPHARRELQESLEVAPSGSNDADSVHREKAPAVGRPR